MPHALHRPAATNILTAMLLLFVATPVDARPVRRMFEPTDLEWEAPGSSELDLQVGAIRGPDAFRLMAPDFELDVGITKQIEIDLDGAFALEGPSDAAARYDHVAFDNLWLALKVGLLSFEDRAHSRTISTGLQIGPKLPTANQAQGMGLESLFLLGLGFGHTFGSLNLGALLDPAIGSTGRPRGFEAGLDLSQELDDNGRWSLVGELGTVQFISADANQLHATAGVNYAPTKAITFSLVGLAGLLRGSDQYGILVGMSPKLRLWGG